LQNQQIIASTIHEYQRNFVPLQRLCAIANYIFGLRCRCSDTFAPFFVEAIEWGVVVFGYPTATQKHKKALQIGIYRVLLVVDRGI
jgi:hypothetical protein